MSKWWQTLDEWWWCVQTGYLKDVECFLVQALIKSDDSFVPLVEFILCKGERHAR
jgi:hypothetical protein